MSIVVPAGGSLTEHDDRVVVKSDTVRFVIDRWPAAERHSIPGISGDTRGTTLEALASSIQGLVDAQPGLSTIRRLSRQIDYVPAVEWLTPPPQIIAGVPTPFVLVVMVSGDSAYSFVGYLDGPASPGLALVQFESDLGWVDLLWDTSVVGLAGGISISLPGTAHVESSIADRMVIVSNGTLFGLSSLVIQRATVGDTVHVRSVDQQPFGLTLDGRNLDEYAASLSANPVPLPLVGHSSMVVDGAPAYEWTWKVRDTFLGPLTASLRLVIVGSDVYVFRGRLDLAVAIRFLP